MSSSTRRNTIIALASVVALTSTAFGLPVLADETTGHCCVEWEKLNLSPQQSQRIQQLEQQWQKDYNQLQPLIQDDQRKLTQLLSDHNSDPMEIMSLQQGIASKREKLNTLATANYLSKRQILNETQQRGLEQQIRSVIAQRKKELNPGAQTVVMPDRVQNLIQRVRDIWPVQSDR